MNPTPVIKKRLRDFKQLVCRHKASKQQRQFSNPDSLDSTAHNFNYYFINMITKDMKKDFQLQMADGTHAFTSISPKTPLKWQL